MRSEFSNGVSGQIQPTSAMAAAQAAAGRWTHATRGQRSASSPPRTTNATKAMCTSTTAVARKWALVSISKAPEPTEPHELVGEPGVGGVAPARVGYHEDPRIIDALELPAGAAARPRTEERAVDRGADERHDLRPDACDQARERHASSRVLRWRQLCRLARGARDDVGQRETERDHARIVRIGQRLGDEPGGMEQLPERVARPREVVAHFGRAQARVDPHKKDPRAGAESVGKAGQALHDSF